jgi:hypothetical protein
VLHAVDVVPWRAILGVERAKMYLALEPGEVT